MRTILLYPGERLALADGTVIEAAVRPSSPMFDAPRDRELSSMTSAIRAATEKVGGQAALARILDVKPPTVNQWVKGERQVPAEQCPAIERATGVRCERLRPDVPWEVLRLQAGEDAAVET
jgi:DNA-binding transcriptional regulator YdaS (Cro superfamily)